MPAPRNFVGEWFGHRLYPNVKATIEDLGDFQSNECPFLTEVTRKKCRCVKNDNSLGVCTITTTSRGLKDWMVCPYRSLDLLFLETVVTRIFQIEGDIALYPVTSLPDHFHELKVASESGATPIVFFQDKLGGEINLSATPNSPELSFDITFVPLRIDGSKIRFRKFGIYEVQTMDFHGSYKHAVTALRNAVDLHGQAFSEMLKDNPEWAGRRIEGPNIANVFKRTFYQLLIKFRLAGHGECEGVVLGLPYSVWSSWAPHLNAPTLEAFEDYQVLEGTHPNELANSWIYIFETDSSSISSREPLLVKNVVRIDVEALLDKAFTDVPEYITSTLIGNIHQSILNRIRAAYSDVEIDV